MEVGLMRVCRGISLTIMLLIVLLPCAGLGDRIRLKNGEALRGEVTVLKDGTIEVLHPDGIEGAITFFSEEIESIEQEGSKSRARIARRSLRRETEPDRSLANPNPLQALELSDVEGLAIPEMLKAVLGSAQGPLQERLGALFRSLLASGEMIEGAKKIEAYIMLRTIKMAQMTHFVEHGRYAVCKGHEEIFSVLGVDVSPGKYFDYSTSGGTEAYTATAVVRPDVAERGELPKDAKIAYSSRTQEYVETGWNPSASDEQIVAERD